MEEMRAGERIGWGVITVVALGVGMLLGGRACAPQDAPHGASSDAGGAHANAGDASSSSSSRLIPLNQCPEKIVEVPPKIIYECPPEPEPDEKKAGKGTPKKVSPPKKSLPEPEPEFDPRDRQRLLAWVRDQSDDLKRCRDDSKEIYRVAVIMYLDKESGQVRRVDVNTTRGETPPNLPGCLKQRILGWKPPKDLVEGRTQLVFGLNI